MSQQELWAAPNALKVLRIALEVRAELGPDVYDLTMAAHGTKTNGPVWIQAQRLTTTRAPVVASEIARVALGRVDSVQWSTEPPTRPQEWWEERLFDF